MIQIAENSKAFAAIQIRPGAGRVERFAALELSRYLSKLASCKFEIKESEIPEAHSIYITSKSEEDSFPDSFKLECGEQRLIIEGSSPRAALYGVYEVLEMLGCSFVEPGIDIIRSKSTLALATMKKETCAAFNLRNIFRIQIMPEKNAPYRGLEEGHHLAQIDFMAKRRLNHYNFYVDYCRYDLWEKYKMPILDAMLDRGFRLELCHHSIGYFFPESPAHDFGNYGDSTYFSKHPEYYENNQVKIELPAIRKILAERYIEFYKRNMELSSIGLWPGDSGMPPPSTDMTVADGYLDFWNEIAAALEKELPGKNLSSIAYIDLLDPPKKLRVAHNENVWFCPILTNYHYAMPGYAYNENFLRKLDGWVKMADPLHINCFDYFGWQPPLIPLARKTAETLKAYRSIGAGGAYGWVGFTYNIMGADYRWAKELFVYTHQMWNPECDVDSLEYEWASGVFGNAGGKVLDFFDYLRKEHVLLARRGLQRTKNWINLDVLHGAQKLLASARVLTNDETAIRRINLLEQVAANGSAVKNIAPGEDGLSPLDVL